MIWKRGLGGDRPPDLADRETQGKRQPRGHRAIHRGRSCRISQFQKPRDTFCLVVFWGFFGLFTSLFLVTVAFSLLSLSRLGRKEGT